MKYARPPYLSPGIPLEKNKLMFSKVEVEIPKPDYPITPLENFKRAAARNDPYWVPNSLTDFQTLFVRDLCIGETIGFDMSRDITKNYEFKDWFGVEWTWVASAGGPMVTPGTQFLDDITNWEKIVKFPDLNNWDWDTQAEAFMKNTYNPSKILHVNFGQSCTERLIALLGGYTEGMLALAIEPEAVKDFLNCFADFTIGLIGMILDRYPVNMITLHDDWGTERDTFFSENMMEEIVFEPSKRIADYIKSRGCIYELHSCGNIMRFVPYMIDLGVDFIQIQRRAVDIPALKKKYGDKIGINTHVEGFIYGQPTPPLDEYLEGIRKSVDLYASGGGFYTNTRGDDGKYLWDSIFELYLYSREFYDNERNMNNHN